MLPHNGSKKHDHVLIGDLGNSIVDMQGLHSMPLFPRSEIYLVHLCVFLRVLGTSVPFLAGNTFGGGVITESVWEFYEDYPCMPPRVPVSPATATYCNPCDVLGVGGNSITQRFGHFSTCSSTVNSCNAPRTTVRHPISQR